MSAEEFVTVGAMHQCRSDAMFSECVKCGAIAEELSKPCKKWLEPTTPAVAVQAEPVLTDVIEAIITERRASWDNASQRDREIAYLALDDLRSKLKFKQRAHPKSSRPATAEELPDSVSHYGLIDERVGATADDSVSDYTPADFACWILDHHPAETTNKESVQRWLAEYNAECSGASAQPAGGAK